MASREKTVVESLRKAYQRSFPRGHWQRLEDAFAVGLPDVNVHVPGYGDLWIEVKNVTEDRLPKRRSTPVRPGLRPEQVIWLHKAQDAGRIVCVLIRVPGLWLWFVKDFRFIEDLSFEGLVDSATYASREIDIVLAFGRIMEAALHNGSDDL
jgi:hypothetical protein